MCDDGNNVNNDGCTNDCKRELDWECEENVCLKANRPKMEIIYKSSEENHYFFVA